MRISVLAKGRYFDYYGAALAEAFRTHGHTCVHVDDDSYTPTVPVGDVTIVVCPDVYSVEHICQQRGRRVGILTEQLPHLGVLSAGTTIERENRFQQYRTSYELFVQWSNACYSYQLARHPDQSVINFPHGYIERGDGSQVSTKDCEWDAAFFGNVSESPRRLKLLNALKDMGFKIFPKHEGVWDEEKYEVIRNTKVNLNIHFGATPLCFEASRFFDVACFGRPFLSEHMAEPVTTLWGSVQQCGYEQYPYTLKTILDSADQLDALGQRFRHQARRYQLTDLASIILQGLEANSMRAAE